MALMKEISQNKRIITISGAVGTIGGLIIVWISLFFIPEVWSPLVAFNGYLGIVEYVQVFLLLFLGSFILSMICFHFFDSLVITEREADLVGGIVGLVVGCLTALSIVILYPLTVDHFFLAMLIHQFIVSVLVIIILSFIQWITVKYYFYFQQSKDLAVKVKYGILIKKYFTRCVFCVFLIILLIPLFSYIGVWTGIIGEFPLSSCCELPVVGISVDRINSTDISIIQFCNSAPVYLDTPEYPFHIFIAGKEVSNISAIQSQELADSISPPNGLINHRGSFINLTGADFIGNNTQGEQLVIVEEFYHSPTKIWYNGSIP